MGGKQLYEGGPTGAERSGTGQHHDGPVVKWSLHGEGPQLLQTSLPASCSSHLGSEWGQEHRATWAHTVIQRRVQPGLAGRAGSGCRATVARGPPSPHMVHWLPVVTTGGCWGGGGRTTPLPSIYFKTPSVTVSTNSHGSKTNYLNF